MNKKFIVLITVCLLFNSYLTFAEIAKGEFSVGLNYPGIAARYFFSNKISTEIKYQAENDIFVVGLRNYYYFSSKIKYVLFTGLEYDFVSFKSKTSEGNGFASELFIGGEYFFTKKLSLQIDFGPAFIFLKDKDTSVSVSGGEYVINFGINYYFSKK